MGLRLVRGRNFSPLFPADTARQMESVIVNETLWNLLGKEAKLGFYCAPIHGTIVGVVKDYHVASLSKKIGPVVLTPATGFVGDYYLKIRPRQTAAVLGALQKQWGGIANHYPLEFTFLDAFIAKMYVPEVHWQQTIQTSCLFAILIATPISWWLMDKWLEDFAYRIELRWWMPVLVGLTAMVIALATVSAQVLRVARANRVDGLRSE
jgi:putative ABC transport system permease protein